MSYGSYFGLDISYEGNGFYHENGIKVNTGRNAFEYILQVNNIEKVYLPYYSCDALYVPLNRLKIPFEFYSININQEPIFDFDKIKKNEYFLYINYLGLHDAAV